MKKGIIAVLAAAAVCASHGVLAADLTTRYSALQSKCSQIKNLLAACEKKGIATDYERVSYRVLQKFITFGKDDIAHDKIERAEYIAECLEKIAAETTDTLVKYRQGKAEPPELDRYVNGDVTADGYSLIADVKNNKTGEISQKPVIFTGYGHFGTVAADIGILKDLGVNIIQQEIVMYDCVVDPNAAPMEGWRRLDIGAVADITHEETNGVDNSECLHIVNPNGYEDGKFVQLYQTVPCEPSTKYTVSVKTKGKGSGACILPNGWNSGSYVFPDSDEYKTTTFSYTSGAEQYSITPYIIINSTADFYIDDISVEANGKNYIHNGDAKKPLKTYTNSGVTFGVDPTPVFTTADTLRRAEAADVRVDVLLAPHYFPDFLTNALGDMKHKQTGIENFSANIYHDLSRAAMKAYIDEVLPYFKGYSSLNSICISNEPGYTSKNNSSYYKAEYAKYLKDLYGTVENLNTAYGASYASFADVPMTKTNASITPEYADWRTWNNIKFAAWHREAAEEIKKIIPGIPVHSKIMNYLRFADDGSRGNYNRYFMDLGTDSELFDEFCDYHGNDAHSYYIVSWAPFTGELMWYDYLASISQKPIFNSEDHIIADRNKDYTKYQATHYRANMWLGALHGRSMQATWVYERTYDTSSLLQDSILDRPDVLEMSGKTALDLNRLSDKVTAFQNQVPEIAIYFSDYTRNYDRAHMARLLSDYEKAISFGKRVAVVSDKEIESGKLDENFKILILPQVSASSETAVSKIAEFAKQGGRIIFGGECLTYDKWHKTFDNSDKEYIKTRWYNGSDNMSDAISSVLNTIDKNRIRVIDTSTGKDITDCDYRAVFIGETPYINICRLDNIKSEEAKNIKIVRGGKTLAPEEDILNRDTETPAVLMPFESRLIRLAEPVNDNDYQIELIKSSGVLSGNYSFTVRATNTTLSDDMLTLKAELSDINGIILKDASFSKNVAQGKNIMFSASVAIPAEGCRLRISVEDSSGVASKNTLNIE